MKQDHLAGSKTAELFDKLEVLEPEDVCLRSLAVFDPAPRTYQIPFFNDQVLVDLMKRTVFTPLRDKISLSPFTGKYFDDWILFYLLLAKDRPDQNVWVHPHELKEGKFFFHGSHELPLGKFSKVFNEHPDLLQKKGSALGRLREDVAGDVCIELHPLPRVPVLLVFWQGDEDLEPNTSFLFDAGVNDHLAIDIIWGLAHLCLEMLLKAEP